MPSFGLIGRVGIGALLLALALAPGIGGYPTGAAYGGDVSLNALRALICVAALCVSLDSPLPPRRSFLAGERGSGLALFLLMALTILSLLVHSAFLTSPVLLFAMLPATLDWLCYALLFLTCARLVERDRSTLGLMIGALSVGAAWTAISGVREYGQNVQNHQAAQRISATFFDPNFAAGFLALSLPVVVAWFCQVRERLGILALGVLSALILAALVGTGSRAGVGIGLAGLTIAFFAAILTGGVRSLPWGRVAALIAAFAVLAFGFRGPLTGRVSGGSTGTAAAGQEHSGAFRTWTWRGTATMAKANPLLGTGPGTFPFRYPPYALVAKTELAHSSYFQLAAEQGFPSLIAAFAAIAVTFFGGAKDLWASRRKTVETTPTERLIFCGLFGALAAGAARSFFDSEWSILGNALPFWAIAGMVDTAIFVLRSPAETEPTNIPPRRFSLLAIPAGVGLIFALLLLRSAQTVDAAQTQIRAHQPVAPASVWPPDPNLRYWARQPEEAARIEPSGRRFFQWARMVERSGDETGAIPLFQKASQADPNNLQTLKALAEAQEKAGDKASSLKTWEELTRRYEGPAGQIRAIPELPETYPAYAYAALARDFKQNGDNKQAEIGYEKAATVIEAYSRTVPVYQQMELASAALNGVDVLGRRAEVRGLYQTILHEWGTLAPAEATALKNREAETLARLEAFAKPDSLDSGSEATNNGTGTNTAPLP